MEQNAKTIGRIIMTVRTGSAPREFGFKVGDDVFASQTQQFRITSGEIIKASGDTAVQFTSVKKFGDSWING